MENPTAGPARGWQAEWIWFGDEPAPYHYHLLLRRSFELASVPGSAALHITASDRYRLFVNGIYLGRGPERCDPRYQSFDTYDLTKRLYPGMNCLAVQVYSYGCITGFTREGPAGLLAQLEIDLLEGDPLVVASNPGWKARPGIGWRRDAKPSGIGVGVTEVYDARLDPPDWMETSFDDRDWGFARRVPLNASQWCSRPEPRETPFLEEQEVFPEEILRVGEVLEFDEALTTVDIAELMAREIQEQLQGARLENPAGLLSPDGDPAVAHPTPHGYGDDPFDGIRDAFLLLDFGRQINAFPRLRVEGAAGSIIDVAYGEQLIGGRIAPLICATRCADRYILRDGLQTIEAFEYKSFRYLQITLRSLSEPIKIHSISANTWRYPAKLRGRFECSDQNLTRLWQACVATTELCTDDAFMDSPLREKRNWTGDGSHALLGAFAAWGDTPVIRRYFNLVRQGALGDGMLRIFFPGEDSYDSQTGILLAIPQHALVWAGRAWEYYWYFGDRLFLEGMAPLLQGLRAWCRRHTNQDGLLDRLPNWNWLDWNPTDLRGTNFSTNAFYLHLLDDLGAMAGILGWGEQAALFESEASQLRTALHDLFWDSQRGVFTDSLLHGRQTGIASELGNGLALLFGIAGEEQAAQVGQALQPQDRSLVPATPLFFHYVPQGLFKAGFPEAALRLMSQRFAPMMAVSGTIWEGWYRHAMLPQVVDASADVPEVIPGGRVGEVIPGFRPGTVSLAHCGGVGVSLLLLTEVLGIQPARAGFETCLIQPQVQLLSRASGVFPSIHGDISVSWERQAAHTRLLVIIPPGIRAELRVMGDRYSLQPGENHLELANP